MLSVEPEIGPTLRKVRLERKWTQAALAFRLGISLDWLQRIELSRGTPSPELTKKLNAWLADPNARLR
ncbi:MAG: Helix-turn-helix domain [Blastocatellia bacterium]|jgi:transcriptional regulator with XRE-family HTH domain|nr:Helix-turn-helix domain [Blastocatellia bacterium]